MANEPPHNPRFRVLKQLGEGGFGVVYLVRDLQRGEDVALKALKESRPEQIYRFKREFRVRQDIRHRNLVAFYELFADGDQIYFTMEYVPGTAFLQYVRPGLAVSEERLRNGLAQLATGLCVLHEAGKLHRDIKPSNVLVTPEGRMVLLDFGLVTEIEPGRLGQSIDSAGTPKYMSPEQARGERLTAASDWYSVGVMLYEALAGCLPFRGSRTELFKEREGLTIPSPKEVNAGVSAEMSELCMSLLAPDPDRRAGALGVFAAVEMAPPKPQAQRSVLVGRAAELEQLKGALARVQAGEGVTVLVDGTSGVGKTSLVGYFLNQERPDAAIVLRGRCYEREQVPYQGIDSLIDDVCRFLNGLDPVHAASVLPRHLAALVRLFPVLERVPAVAERRGRDRFVSADEREIRRQAFGAFRELLAQIGDRRTLIVHIDDLQWGDLDTAGLLRDVLRPPDAPIMLLILAYRSEDQERSPCVRVLAQEPIGAEARVHLGPLSADAAEALVRELLPSHQSNLDVPQLLNEAGGNPFLLHEVAWFAELQEAGIGANSLGVRSALRFRIDRLPPAALELLQAVAVAGHPITEEVAWRAAAPTGSATAAWRLLVDEHLVRLSGPLDARLVEPFHDRVREAVLASITPQRARACHRGLATALEQAGGADPEVLAWHHESSGNPERALEFIGVAATQATKALAFDRAARLLKHAVALAGPSHAQRVDLLSALAEALGNAGRCADSAREYREAADSAEPDVRIMLRRRAASQLLFAGKIDEGRELIRDDLRAQHVPVPKTPGRTLVSVLLLRAWIQILEIVGAKFHEAASADILPEARIFLDHLRSVAVVMSFVDVALGAEIGARFLLRARAVGDRHFFALGLGLLAGHAGAEAPFSRRTRYLFEQVAQYGGGVEDPAVNGTLTAVRGLWEYFAGSWRSAVQHLDSAEQTLQNCQGFVCELWSTRAVGIWSRFFLGDWGEMARRVFRGLGDARDRGNAYGMACVCSPFGVAAWLSGDEPAEARRALHEVTSAWSVEGFQIQDYWFLMAESFVQLYTGDGPGAWARMCSKWKSAAASLTMRFPANKAQLLHMRGCCALAAAEQSRNGAKRDLAREAERAARRLERVGVKYAAPFADLLRAGVAAQSGSDAEAAKHLEAAVLKLDRQEMPVYAAAARRRLARLRGEGVPKFLPRQNIANVDAITRMLVPGFSSA
jgi:eukaryotic-like serine/threonine-protein kinase